ncbi:MAG: alpha/beta-type small acid-soluble spore protein [Clostridia bacterium]|nr:alpha/beta-type small acid-soluble spore protein [Clostridia bacterium]
MARNTNKPAIQGASTFLDSFKFEVANELGLTNYNQVDKGSLSSRENGYVGGYMVRKMIQFAEQHMGTQQPQQ